MRLFHSVKYSRTSHEVRGLKLLHVPPGELSPERRTSHEVRGLKYHYAGIDGQPSGRTSHEVRGLKYTLVGLYNTPNGSHLTRGAWIEIYKTMPNGQLVGMSHLTRGAWIEITTPGANIFLKPGRTSHEVRGLKYCSNR